MEIYSSLKEKKKEEQEKPDWLNFKLRLYPPGKKPGHPGCQPNP
jgi:hypothetical protein